MQSFVAHNLQHHQPATLSTVLGCTKQSIICAALTWLSQNCWLCRLAAWQLLVLVSIFAFAFFAFALFAFALFALFAFFCWLLEGQPSLASQVAAKFGRWRQLQNPRLADGAPCCLQLLEVRLMVMMHVVHWLSMVLQPVHGFCSRCFGSCW